MLTVRGSSSRRHEPGDIIIGYFVTARRGTVKAVGQKLSAAAYPALWREMGEPALDGNGDFTMPDARAAHFRVVDDGKGIDPDRSVGTVQDWAIKNHQHQIDLYAAGSSFATVSGHTSGTGSGGAQFNPVVDRGVKGVTVGWPGNASLEVPAANRSNTELRPRNCAVLACVAY